MEVVQNYFPPARRKPPRPLAAASPPRVRVFSFQEPGSREVNEERVERVGRRPPGSGGGVPASRGHSQVSRQFLVS